ncbi:MAG: cupin domain-containing protein, partial [Acidobacteriota bacterium]|nr:cupin domain-containing protein [Acidobacteriota bacterium]
CEVCEAELKPLGSVVAALGLAASLESPQPAAREKLMFQIAAEAPAPIMSAVSREDSLKQFYSMRVDQGDWRETFPGMFEKQLFADEKKATTTTLIRLAPGTKIPSHRHLGTEECLVIEGDFHVNGEMFGPGDYRCAMPDSIDQSPSSVNGALLLIVVQQGIQELSY